MKYIFLLFVIIFFISPLYSADLITLKAVSGKVEIKEPGGAWSSAFSGREIPPGSLISTGFKSSAELDLSRSSTVYVKQLTRMAVDKLLITGKKVDTELNLKLGRIRANVKTSEGLKHNFTLRTPVSTAAVRGTVFEGGANGDLAVETGQMRQTNKIGQSTTVSGGNSSSVSGGGYSPPATAAETTAETFTVETSTQPEDTVPIAPPQTTEPENGTVTLDWSLLYS